jgi:hypothetical protein
MECICVSCFKFKPNKVGLVALFNQIYKLVQSYVENELL